MPPASIEEVWWYNAKELSMSNVKVRKDGWYLVRHFNGMGLSVEKVHNGELYFNGEYYPFNGIHLHWISDEPLNLEDLYDNSQVGNL